MTTPTTEKPTHVWVFDENRRVYPRDANGKTTGGPIYREYWVKRPITGETSRSWIVGERWCRRKIPKRGKLPFGVCMTDAEVDDLVWQNDHAYKIEQAVRACRDVPTLRAVAKMLGVRDE